ncbi:hypothetical protein D3093_35490 (plasmid) [Azospirillum argentinense]|uniref:Uncharacterized protein n=1 Tax=Azospirillum argentinense TaxID=2970906 RepID=A0A4D8PUP3_9PROT|nr:hypothetical protein [Azospirillum argentinense]QCO00548.1 hypothetical protein D3093_35490 [Azospirillum argentinense]
MARIKQSGIQNRLFLPIDATTDYLLARIGDQPVGTERLHWKGAVMEVENNSVIGTGRGIRILRKLFEGVKTEADFQGCPALKPIITKCKATETARRDSLIRYRIFMYKSNNEKRAASR